MITRGIKSRNTRTLDGNYPRTFYNFGML